MHSRVIRGGDLLESERYMTLRPEDQVFYLHCLLCADDFGMVCLTPLTIGRRVWLKRPADSYITKRIAAVEGADLIRTYECDGILYGFVPRFRQRMKNFRTKHPMPPDELFQDDGDAVKNFTSNRHLFKKQAPSRRQALPKGGHGRLDLDSDLDLDSISSRKDSERDLDLPLQQKAAGTETASPQPIADAPAFKDDSNSKPETKGYRQRAAEMGLTQNPGETDAEFQNRTLQTVFQRRTA